MFWLHFGRDFRQKVNFCCRTKRELTLVTRSDKIIEISSKNARISSLKKK